MDSLNLRQATDSSRVMTGLEGVIPIVWRTQNHLKVVFKSCCCSAFVATSPNCSLRKVWHILVWCISPIFFPLFILTTSSHHKSFPKSVHQSQCALFQSNDKCHWGKTNLLIVGNVYSCKLIFPFDTEFLNYIFIHVCCILLSSKKRFTSKRFLSYFRITRTDRNAIFFSYSILSEIELELASPSVVFPLLWVPFMRAFWISWLCWFVSAHWIWADWGCVPCEQGLDMFPVWSPCNSRLCLSLHPLILHILFLGHS